MRKKISVRKYFRRGKPVVGHERIVDVSEPEIDIDSATGAAAGVQGLAVDETEQAEVTKEVLEGQKFERCTFTPDTLQNYKRIENCVFDKVGFGTGDFSGVEFVNCTFQDCEFHAAGFSGVQIDGCSFTKSKFYGKESSQPWENFKFKNCSFQDVNLSAVALHLGTIEDCTFDGLKAVGSGAVGWRNVTIKNSKMTNSDITNVDLTGSLIDGCALEKTHFSFLSGTSGDKIGDGHDGSLIEPAPFAIHRSSLTDCTFTDSNLKDVNFIDNRVSNLKIRSCKANRMNFFKSRGKSLEFEHCDLYDARFDESSFSDVNFGKSYLWSSTWSGAYLDAKFNDVMLECYTQHSMQDALDRSGMSQAKFEFLVMSGAVEVRDNRTLQKVTSGFDIDKHHVPPWVYENIDNLIPKSSR